MPHEVDHSDKPLGKAPYVVRDDRTLPMSRYLTTGALPVPPPSVDRLSKMTRKKGTAPYSMMGNDKWGDCGPATTGHVTQILTANASKEVTPTDAQVLALYTAITGFDPRTGANDTGVEMLDLMNAWRKTGVGGHRILGYVKLTTGDWGQFQEAVYLFGAVALGWALPLAAQTLSTWDVPAGQKPTGRWKPYSWGGHATAGVGYGTSGKLITWGAEMDFSPAFYRMFCDEAYVPLSADWIGSNGLDPDKLDIATLNADLKLFGSGLA